MPYRLSCRASRINRPAWAKVRTGTGPSLAAIPPNSRLATTVARAPRSAARRAASTPAGPRQRRQGQSFFLPMFADKGRGIVDHSASNWLSLPLPGKAWFFDGGMICPEGPDQRRTQLANGDGSLNAQTYRGQRRPQHFGLTGPQRQSATRRSGNCRSHRGVGCRSGSVRRDPGRRGPIWS